MEKVTEFKATGVLQFGYGGLYIDNVNVVDAIAKIVGKEEKFAGHIHISIVDLTDNIRIDTKTTEDLHNEAHRSFNNLLDLFEISSLFFLPVLMRHKSKFDI